MMASFDPIVLALVGVCLSAVVVSGQVSPCQDLDTTACVLLHKQKADLCADPSFSTIACKRFCGLCPLTCYDCPTPVLKASDCNTTMACPLNQTCMTRSLHHSDGHREYLMSCEPKGTCNGFGLGFVGKRGIQSRDVSLDCCDTDFCNMPTMTTTTTTPQVTRCGRDIVFVVDDSGSVGAANFQHIKDFVKDTINGLDIGSHANQVACIAFSSTPQQEWFLNTYHDKSSLVNATGNIRYHSGGTRTDLALDYVRNQIFVSAKGDRPSVRNVAIVLTDGKSNMGTLTGQSAAQLKMVTDVVISIGVGTGADTGELNTIATDGHHVLDTHNFAGLTSIIQQLLNLICT